jgi:hypothetical protein
MLKTNGVVVCSLRRFEVLPIVVALNAACLLVAAFVHAIGYQETTWSWWARWPRTPAGIMGFFANSYGWVWVYCVLALAIGIAITLPHRMKMFVVAWYAGVVVVATVFWFLFCCMAFYIMANLLTRWASDRAEELAGFWKTHSFQS